MNPAVPSIYQLRISLAEIEPRIWRRILVSSRTTLHELHRTIQLVFSWFDYHLYEFQFGERRFQAPDPEAEVEDASRITLAALRLRTGDAVTYIYDFGDDWTHVVEVEDVNASAHPGWIPYLVGGARRGPPEDCGGPHGYMALLAALERPLEDLGDDDREFVEWAGLDFDPAEFSLEQARHALLLSAAWGTLKRRR